MNLEITKTIRNHFDLGKRPLRGGWWKTATLTPLLAVLPLAPQAMTQATDSQAISLEEVIVSARRQDESLQDVPVTVNVVTGDMLEDMNIRRFEDLQDLVAGLELTDRPVGATASMRGVRFDAFASGNNPSVEFYLNDALINSVAAMNSMFDIGMVEVLRGPQGTLRGRASPSGSILMTSRRPDLDRFTADLDMTTTNKGGRNVRGGLSIPIIEDTLGVRVAGFVEENRIDHAKSFRTGERSEMESEGFRVSVRYEPVDTFSINAYYQKVDTDRSDFETVESAHLRNSSLAPAPEAVRASDRLSVQLVPNAYRFELERAGFEAQWDLGPVQVHYTAQHTKAPFRRKNSGDLVGFFGEAYPHELDDLGQAVSSRPDSRTHELRFAGDLTERLSYLVGGFYSKYTAPTDVDEFTPVFLMGTAPENYLMTVVTPVVAQNKSKERSVFANLTFRLTDATELSGGLRYIDYESLFGNHIVGGASLGERVDDASEIIYTASLSHNFSDDLMAYVAAGSSWRPGTVQVGNTDTQRTPLEQSFLSVDAESSDSIEFGIKSTSLDGRLRINASVFYQKFDNYPDRGAGGDVRFVNRDIQGNESVATGAFMAAMDVDAYGLELDGAFQITDNWDVSGTYSWSQGTQSGTIGCNDYFPRNGSPDQTAPPITVQQIRDATGGEDISSCSIETRSYEGPTWSASIRTEYGFPLFDQYNGYIRLQSKIYGNAKGQINNPNDEVNSYAIFDLYAGVRSPQGEWGRWEAMVFAKNILNTVRTADFGTDPLTTNMQVVPFGGQQLPSSYRTVELTAPREFGVNLRYTF